MQKMRVILDNIQPGLEKQMTYHSMKHDTLKNQILQNEIYKNLDNTEKKMMFNEQQIYAMRTFIESKSMESNFQHQLNEVMAISNDLNNFIIKKTLS